MGIASKRVLLADDDADDRYLFEEALRKIPLDTTLNTVGDGIDLMDYLTANIERLPDVIFLDLNMPRKNGQQCLSEINENEKLKSLCIIVYSTSLDNRTVDELYKNGATYYIRKPSTYIDLKNIVHNALELVIAPDHAKPNRENFVLYGY